jgi:hypothetical protein
MGLYCVIHIVVVLYSVIWYTSMLGKKTSVRILRHFLQSIGLNRSQIQYYRIQQGQTHRWILAWTFLVPAATLYQTYALLHPNSAADSTGSTNNDHNEDVNMSIDDTLTTSSSAVIKNTDSFSTAVNNSLSLSHVLSISIDQVISTTLPEEMQICSSVLNTNIITDSLAYHLLTHRTTTILNQLQSLLNQQHYYHDYLSKGDVEKNYMTAQGSLSAQQPWTIEVKIQQHGNVAAGIDLYNLSII